MDEALDAIYRQYNETIGYSYVQLFRNGIIESMEGRIFSSTSGKIIDSFRVENYLIRALGGYLTAQKQLGVSPPILVLLSFLNVDGYSMSTGDLFSLVDPRHVIADKNLVIPEELVDQFDLSPAQILRPIFDRIWNASGWPRSMHYDDNGARKQPGQ